VKQGCKAVETRIPLLWYKSGGKFEVKAGSGVQNPILEKVFNQESMVYKL
jgi:hypothetical protein